MLLLLGKMHDREQRMLNLSGTRGSGPFGWRIANVCV
jgi:hypothetical protein